VYQAGGVDVTYDWRLIMLDKLSKRAYVIPTTEEFVQSYQKMELPVEKVKDVMEDHRLEPQIAKALEPWIGDNPRNRKKDSPGFSIEQFHEDMAYKSRKSHLLFMVHFVNKWKDTIKEVQVRFEGSGDSGDMYTENIIGLDGKELVVTIPSWAEGIADEYHLIGQETYDAIAEDVEEWAHPFLSDCVIDFDWWNNDGGQGNCTINLQTGECEMDGSVNTTADVGNHFNFISDGRKEEIQHVKCGEGEEAMASEEFLNKLRAT
jgi:hypothetical protein